MTVALRAEELQEGTGVWEAGGGGWGVGGRGQAARGSLARAGQRRGQGGAPCASGPPRPRLSWRKLTPSAAPRNLRHKRGFFARGNAFNWHQRPHGSEPHHQLGAR